MFKAQGIIPAMVSPVDDAGRVRQAELRRLTDYLIAHGVHGLFVNGSQGEFYATTPQEKQAVLEIVADQTRGRVPVFAGVGAVTTREAVALAKMSEQCGAQALTAVTPYFIKPSDEELYQHYRVIAAATTLPLYLYPNPSRTNVAMPVPLVARLAKIDNIVGIKDSSGDLTMTGEYIRVLGAQGFQVLAGRDTLILATLVYGGAGAIAATANVAPKQVVAIYEAFQRGDLAAARAAQYRLAPLRLAFDLGSFPAVIKEALRLIGYDVGPAILPVGGMAPDKLETLRQILREMDLEVVA